MDWMKTLLKLQEDSSLHSYNCLMAENQNKKQKRKIKKNIGKWTRAEHQKFMELIEKYGKNWMKIQKKIKTRTAQQIRSHAQKVFLAMTKQDIDAFIGLSYSSDKQSQVIVKRSSGKSDKTQQPGKQKNEDKFEDQDDINSEVNNLQIKYQQIPLQVSSKTQKNQKRELYQILPKKQERFQFRMDEQNKNVQICIDQVLKALQVQQKLIIQALMKIYSTVYSKRLY